MFEITHKGGVAKNNGVLAITPFSDVAFIFAKAYADVRFPLDSVLPVGLREEQMDRSPIEIYDDGILYATVQVSNQPVYRVVLV